MSVPGRRDVQIASHGEVLSAWVYAAKGVAPGKRSPVVVMAHGLGGTKAMRLDAFAERFSAAGIVCVVFDYRFFGESTGKPRGLIDIARQLEDWDEAIDYASKLEEVDAGRIGLFGSSFSGGHVIRLAAKHGQKIKATVSQCPFTDGFASAPTVGFSVVPKVALLAVKDFLFGTKENPVRIPLYGKAGETALMNAPDAIDGLARIQPDGKRLEDVEVRSHPARIGLWLSLYRPGTYASQVPSPIYFAVCGKDTVAPAGRTLTLAKQAPKGTIKVYEEYGHFEVYIGEPFEHVSKDYVEFYKTHLL